MPTWPKILPSADQQKLKSRTALNKRIKRYEQAIRRIPKPDRDAVLAAVTDQNRIAELLGAPCDCASLDSLHADAREPIKDLFEFGFKLLTDLGVRDTHYQAIYESSAGHICPFCGTEFFEAPGAPREALDHYLAKSRYPFAAANLRNLAPMGYKCNSNYKKAEDILRDVTGARRVALDPYSHSPVTVALDNSEPFGGSTVNTPDWVIEFIPDSPATQTWDDVFKIRKRYRESHLDRDYAKWLSGFSKWARREGVIADTDEALLKALRRYEDIWIDNEIQDRAFLKAAVFRMLRLRCEQGHERLKRVLRDLIALRRGPSVA
ncbi:MAG: hypothetical protein MZW92_16045 [Comamonadaceae bacterium]|nr:hypothetical protein [Comamonadaceae bacterium]